MTLERMKADLAISSVPPAFETLYTQMADTWEDRAALILSDSYLADFMDTYGLFKLHREQILSAAKGIRENPALSLLVCLLEGWIRGGNKPDDSYIPPRGEGVVYDLLHLFPAIPAIPDCVAHLHKRKVPEDVIATTMMEFSAALDGTKEKYGRPIFTKKQLIWKCSIIHNRFLHIGRFNFDLPDHFIEGVRIYQNKDGSTVVLADKVQVHAGGRLLGSAGHADKEGSFYAEVEETEKDIVGYPVKAGLVQNKKATLPKDQWKLSLCPNDLVPRIHIPRDGSFDRKTVEESYGLAQEIFQNCYPDYPCKAFFCESWLLSEQLKDFLKPDSKILGFQNRFIKVPLKSGGEDVFDFAFSGHKVDREHPETLPEGTTLQRGVKNLYVNGEFLHEGAGFFYITNEKEKIKRKG